MNKENKLCPFCRKTELFYHSVFRRIFCKNCGAMGPRNENSEEAWAKWNNRNNSFTQCEYFPCHKGVENFDCTFCYCPLYVFPDCGGDYIMLPNGIKDCSRCTRPHKPENRQEIIETLIRLKKKGSE